MHYFLARIVNQSKCEIFQTFRLLRQITLFLNGFTNIRKAFWAAVKNVFEQEIHNLTDIQVLQNIQ